MRALRWCWAVLIVLTVALGGCGRLQEGLEDVKRTQAALKAELGYDAGVSFKTTNGHTAVHVQLATPPTGDPAKIKAQVTAVVNRNFRSKVERVDLSF